ncbi:uncharacterized protein [Antedon mediterranea]|uniref:uncharacterized protein n=1 Tax=Antedon mediterranea TaxID=105859 RepID=UPI003AF5ACBB
MLSIKEALGFLEDNLRITEVENKLKENRPELLKELLYNFIHVAPFQSIRTLSTKPDDRHLPSFQEIKEDIFDGKGGLCYALNQFIKELLNVLNYDVYYAQMAILDVDKSHVMVMVRNLIKPGDLHLVDVGMGHGSSDPIPLDFKEESPVYHIGFLYLKFVREDNVIIRYHKHDKKYEFPVNIDSKAWHVFGRITITPQDLDVFKPIMRDIYTVPGAFGTSPFLTELRCVIFEKGKIVAIKDTVLLVENDEHQLEVQEMTTHAQIISKVLKHFPSFSREMIEDALQASIVCSNIEKS